MLSRRTMPTATEQHFGRDEVSMAVLQYAVATVALLVALLLPLTR